MLQSATPSSPISFSSSQIRAKSINTMNAANENTVGSSDDTVRQYSQIGNVIELMPYRKKVTVNSLNEMMNANSIPAKMPGFISGKITSTSARSGPAPMRQAASSYSGPIDATDAAQFFTVKGNAK